MDLLGERETAAIISDHIEQMIVVLRKRVESCLEIVFRAGDGDRGLPTAVSGGAIVGGDGNIRRSAFEGGTIEVQERRDREQRARIERVRVGKDRETVLLTLTVTHTGGLAGGVIRDLVEIGAITADETQLVLRIKIEL